MFEEATSDQAPDRIGDWMVRGGIALAFVVFGFDKFPAGGPWVKFFDQIGVGQWFRYFTGIVEVVGGVLVLFPFRIMERLGLGMLLVTMVVASGIHIVVMHQPSNAIVTGVFCMGLAAAFWRSWDRR